MDVARLPTLPQRHVDWIVVLLAQRALPPCWIAALQLGPPPRVEELVVCLVLTYHKVPARVVAPVFVEVVYLGSLR